MSFYKYLQSRIEHETSEKSPKYREWRKMDASISRLEKPSKLPRARRLGYKSKQGYAVVLCRIKKGNRHKTRPKAGRKPSKMGVRKYSPKKSKQKIAEERVAKRFPNMKVLNSYLSADDSIHEFYEVILRV